MRLLYVPAKLARLAILGPWQIVFALARFVVRRSWMFIILAIVTTVFLAPGVGLLETKGGFDTLVSPDAAVSKNTERLEGVFGGDPIVVILKGSVSDVFSPESLRVLERFEESFSPESDERVHSVIGPVTILKAAAAKARGMGVDLEWNDPQIIRGVLGDSPEERRPEIAGLIPDENHVLTTVTYSGSAEYEDALSLLRDIESFFDENDIPGVRATVTGDLEMMDEIERAIGSNMTWLLAMSVGVMALILIISFRVRWNLLALCMVGLAALWTFGIMGYLGVPLSMATMAVLPVLLGLGIDYSIQFHKRYQEEVARVQAVDEALTVSTARMFPSVGIALLSTLIGFMTLFISEVPMIREFGLMLAIGMVIAYLVAFFTLNSIIGVHERRLKTISLGKAAQAATRIMERSLSVLARTALKFPLLLLVLAVSAAVAGAVVDQWLPTNSDFESLMPQSSQALDEIEELRDAQGFMGRLRFLVESDDVANREVLGWIQRYQADMLDRYGNTDESHERILVGVDSPVTLIKQQAEGEIPDQQDEIEKILAATPSIFVDQFISADRRLGHMAFYVSYDSVDEVKKTMDEMMEDAREMTIPGVEITPAGSTALGAKALNAMVGNRYLMNELCLGATFVVLLVVYRRLTRSMFTIIPVGLVIGWSSLSLYLAGVALNPMTAVMGVLVIGIGTEFMVLILGRYQEERDNQGLEPHGAMVTAISTTGQAIVATALTTLGGFGVLISSNFVLIRDFGIATTIAVLLCVLASMVVMPPLIVWWDRHVAGHLPRRL